MAFIGNQYDLKTTSLKRAEQFEKISNIACKVAVIAGSFKDLYDSCENYFDKNNAETMSNCISEIFRFASTLVNVTDGGLIGNIISEELKLGAFLLEKGTELTVEYNKRFEALEDVWNELEKSDNGVDESLQKKVNQSIVESAELCQNYEIAEWYDAIMQEYGWLFDIPETEESEALKAQSIEIKTALSKGREMMDMYNKVFDYATVENYLGAENSGYKVFTKDNKSKTNNAKDVQPNKDPIVIFKSMESRYDLSILDGRRGGGPYLEKVSSSNSSVLERSRCQSLMMIFQVFLEMENGSEMY